ncbi:MAG: glycosyltransferase family 4 protein [Armatimonadota bacterium]
MFAWELRTALAVALLRKLRTSNRRSGFVAVGPILKGPLLRILPLIRWLLGEADKIVCFSLAECEAQARLLGLPRERFVFLPTAWESEPTAMDDEGYVLALGHSSRDYATLLEAVRGTDVPVIIAAKEAANLGGAILPPNVTGRYRTESEETNRLVGGARLHVIPLHDSAHSAGQSVLLRAMAKGKAVVVTDTAGVRDYVQDGETAVLVPAGDAMALRAALLRLWGNSEERQRIGKNAARIQRQDFSFPHFTRSLVAVAEEVVHVRQLRS